MGGRWQMLEPGALVGPYSVVERVGAGGMGVTYLARREGWAGFSRPVALKLLHPNLADDRRLVEMFLDEARLAARLQHSNVVGVEDCGESEQGPFLVMPYVHGASLGRVAEAATTLGRRLSIELALHVAIRVADGLQAVHELVDDEGRDLAVVHRDVSPQNILLGLNGLVAITDFGVAKSRQRARESTAGAFRGKLGYMAPEQLMGEPVDARTDVYGLGVVLWEMLTGRRAFGGTVADTVRQIETRRLEPARQLRSEIPEAVEDALLGALAPEKDARPASARAFRRALAQAMPEAGLLDDEPLSRLVGALFGDELDALRGRVPGSVSSALHLAPRPQAGSDPFDVQQTQVDRPRVRRDG